MNFKVTKANIQSTLVFYLIKTVTKSQQWKLPSHIKFSNCVYYNEKVSETETRDQQLSIFS